MITKKQADELMELAQAWADTIFQIGHGRASTGAPSGRYRRYKFKEYVDRLVMKKKKKTDQ